MRLSSVAVPAIKQVLSVINRPAAVIRRIRLADHVIALATSKDLRKTDQNKLLLLPQKSGWILPVRFDILLEIRVSPDVSG